MEDVNKTLADISAELRRMAEAQYEAWMNDPSDAPDGREWDEFFNKLADRIDAAAVVQQSLPTETVTKCNGFNAAAMREALLRCDAIAQLPETRELQSIKDMRNIIKRALAAPSRNCDKPEFATAEQARAALKRRFPVEEWSGALRMAVNWLYDTMDYCLALPVSRRFGSSQEGGK